MHFLCVGTPQRPDEPGRRPEPRSTAPSTHARPAPDPARRSWSASRPCRSAPRPGWPRGCAELAPAGADAELAWNPEFLREGFAVEDTLRPDRLVLGVASERAEKMLREVYATVIDAGTPVVVTDFATAELVKVSANAFLATKISFINAVAEVAR